MLHDDINDSHHEIINENPLSTQKRSEQTLLTGLSRFEMKNLYPNTISDYNSLTIIMDHWE
ncbi:hypothetical protein GcM3_207013 [Golovinomyces cichoracearum]|uniref:Uncharacterized protein n=1 Tax=Golovinomyces cichoracearum TaxID=62708 RepID=A0A420HBE1_9PEZI|nr:hypothetical protein GcM3_207013 [Golovinomyces cichoracearum]